MGGGDTPNTQGSSYTAALNGHICTGANFKT